MFEPTYRLEHHVRDSPRIRPPGSIRQPEWDKDENFKFDQTYESIDLAYEAARSIAQKYCICKEESTWSEVSPDDLPQQFYGVVNGIGYGINKEIGKLTVVQDRRPEKKGRG